MLAATAVASPPLSLIPPTVLSSEPSNWWSPSRRVRAAQTTRPPSAAKTRAISAPMPRLAPVTITLFPSSLPTVASSQMPSSRDASEACLWRWLAIVKHLLRGNRVQQDDSFPLHDGLAVLVEAVRLDRGHPLFQLYALNLCHRLDRRSSRAAESGGSGSGTRHSNPAPASSQAPPR